MRPRPAPRTYRVKSFGCQMNVYDGDRMAELLDESGMTAAADGADADLVVLNTCHIREKATEKVYSDIGRLIKGREQPPLIAVAGCVAQAEGEEIMARAPAVSMVVGPQAYHALPAMIDEAARGRRSADTDMPAIAKFAALPARRRVAPAAFLTVQEGCDKFCTYCVVPYTRGAEISRPFGDLVGEAERLVEAGAREITLLGQNVSAWRGEDAKGRALGLAGLIRALAKLPDLARIRYTTSHPADMDDDLIAAHGEVAKLMPYLHLPVQSGSDRVLRAMNRSHTADSYLPAARPLPRRAARPGAERRLHRRLPRRDRGRVRGNPAAGRCGRLRPGVQFQILAPPRYTSGTPRRASAGGSHGRAPATPADCPAPPPTGVQRAKRRTRLRRSDRAPRQARRSMAGQDTLAAIGLVRRGRDRAWRCRSRPDRKRRAGVGRCAAVGKRACLNRLAARLRPPI